MIDLIIDHPIITILIISLVWIVVEVIKSPVIEDEE